MSSVQKITKKVSKKLDNKNPPKKGKSETVLISLDKKVTTEPIEKEMLKGQEHKIHIEEVQNEEKNSIENYNELNNNDQENVSNIEKNEETKEKGIIRVKPRETYLKEKMRNLNYSEKLLSNINKSLDN